MEIAHAKIRDYEYYRALFANIPKPFAFLDLDLLDENIRDILSRRNGKKIRVASKSIRCVDVLKRILSSDPDAFSGVMAFTAEEALYLSQHGIREILIGYPVWNRALIEEIAKTGQDGGSITLMVDSVEHLRHLSDIGQQANAVLSVCLDVDMSTSFPGLHFGVHRSPLANLEQARPVIDAALELPFVRLDGLMGYEAQIAGVGDAYPSQALKNQVVRQLKHRSIKPILNRRKEVVSYLLKRQPDVRFINGGGTGSIDTTTAEDVVTEVTVGSGFYAPGLFDNYHSFRYRPAIGYAIEVVRKPRSDIVTCAGGGYVASGAAGTDKLPKPYLPQGLKLLANEGAGEVQTPLRVPAGMELSLGDPVFMRHSKAGELCERFNRLYCVQNGSVIGTMSTYRGDGQCFL
jgi:D-serine deaminase-like pyridoxal phosphate-dependent protein